MNAAGSRLSVRPPFFRTSLTITFLLSGIVSVTGAFADDNDANFRPGNLLISRSVYDNNPAECRRGHGLAAAQLRPCSQLRDRDTTRRPLSDLSGIMTPSTAVLASPRRSSWIS